MSASSPDERAAAAHYAHRDDQDSQTSPGMIRDALVAWLGSDGLAGPALDLGTGVGGNLDAMRERFAVVGAEISASAAALARRLAPVVVADGASLPFADETFGVVVCTEVLEHVDEPGAVFVEMARVMRPDAMAFVTTPNYANLAGVHKLVADRRSGRNDWNPWGAHHGGYEAFMTARKLRAAAAPSFEVVRVRGHDFGQALTGRFGLFDKAAWSGPGQKVLRRLLPAMERRNGGWLSRHGMHVELVLRRRGQ